MQEITGLDLEPRGGADADELRRFCPVHNTAVQEALRAIIEFLDTHV